MSDPSPALRAAIGRLEELLDPEEPWGPLGVQVADDRLLASPLGALIAALGETPDQALRVRRWGRLCVAVCRRVQAVWELQSDDDPLTPRVRAASDRLLRGADWPVGPDLRGDPGWPTLRGRPLNDDCDINAPMLAGLAVLWLVSFADDPRPGYATACVRGADQAFYLSLGDRDVFRRWVLEFAVPAAWADRELTPREQEALRDYDRERVRLWRG